MKKILMLKGQSKNNVVRYFGDELAEGLRKQGCQVEVLDLYMGDGEETILRIRELQYDVPDVVLSFNGIGRDLIRNYMDVPYIGWLVDHPTIHHPRLVEWGKKDYAITIDYTHKELIDKHYPNVEEIYYIPHGGIKGKCYKPFSERDIDVMFSGTYTSSNVYLQNMQKALEPYEQKVAFILLTQMQEHNLTLEQALEKFLTENGIPFTDEEFVELCYLYVDVDYFIRAFFREELIRSLTDKGVVVDIYGGNWEQFECNNKECLRLHRPVDFMEAVELMGNAKFSLNTIPSFKFGGHERIFTSMLNGAICVTDPNDWLEEQFQDGESILYYSRNQMQDVAAKIFYYLQNEEAAIQITEKAYELAINQHTWDVRAKKLLEIINLVTE